MIKLIIFDLDGVLIDSRDLHYKALNMALDSIDKRFIISREEHLSTYDGLSTTSKLKLLTKLKSLSTEYYDIIWKRKQSYTWDIIKSDFQIDHRIINILSMLKKNGYKIYVASNSVRKTIFLSLLKKGFLYFIDHFISNEDVKYTKPNPEIYFRSMIHAGVGVKETIIIEDSHIGREAAINSGAFLLPVKDIYDYDLKKIERFIKSKMDTSTKQKWMGELNVVIPMAGRGSRFEETGLYSFPKPLIDVNGKPMIQVVVDNLNLDTSKTQFIYICQKEHVEKYNLIYLLNIMTPNCKIIEIDGITEGAACSILLAKEYINNDTQLLLANSDQFMEWDSNIFMYSMQDEEIDGGIVTFENSHPKWSYAKLGDDNFVCAVAEKKPISTNATTGIYLWKKGSDFVKYAEQMMKKNIRVNGEFYTCPVFNEAILDNKKIRIFPIERMWGIGVPEDLQYFLQNYKKKKKLNFYFNNKIKKYTVMRFEIIASFNELDQDIIDIDLPDSIYTKEDEEQFVKNILNCMDEESVKQLLKLSVCQNIKKSQSEAIEWLMDRDGKYYFNYGVNNDEDTKRWYDFKNNYIQNKYKF